MLTHADRLISMSTPGFGLHKDYRNDIHDVVRFFHKYHYGKFRVYNLCEGASVTTALLLLYSYKSVNTDTCVCNLCEEFEGDYHPSMLLLQVVP